MKSTTLSSVGFALLGTAQAGVIVSRQASFTFECNGQQFPDVGACDEVFNAFFSDGTSTFNHPASFTLNTLTFNVGDEKNCQIDIVFGDRDYTVTGNQVFQAYDAVKATCFPYGTGGSANEVGGRFNVNFRTNPNYKAPGKRSVKLIPQGKRAERRAEKRADGDTEFRSSVYTKYAKPGNMKHNIGAGLPGGSTWTWSSEQSVTDTVTFSSSVSAGIEGVIGASLSTEISSSTTTTSGQSSTITVNCEDNQYGQIYFQGYAEEWRGVLLPSGEQLTVWKPMVANGNTEGFYSYECIQK